MLNPSYGVLSSIIASLGALNQASTAVAAPSSPAMSMNMGTEVCALSTVYITVTGSTSPAFPAAPTTTIATASTASNIPYNPLWSQSHTSASTTTLHTSLNDAISGSVTHTVTKGAAATPTPAVASNTTYSSNSTNPAASPSPFLTPNNSNSSTAPTVGVYSHMALVLTFVGALVLFAV
jgi:hypothetical protein